MQEGMPQPQMGMGGGQEGFNPNMNMNMNNSLGGPKDNNQFNNQIQQQQQPVQEEEPLNKRMEMVPNPLLMAMKAHQQRKLNPNAPPQETLPSNPNPDFPPMQQQQPNQNPEIKPPMAIPEMPIPPPGFQPFTISCHKKK